MKIPEFVYKTEQEIEGHLKKLNMTKKSIIRFTDHYNGKISNEDMLLSLDAYEKSGVSAIKYLQAIIENKITENFKKINSDKRQLGTPPKENY